MAFYNYTSLSPDGKRHKGIKEATSEADLKVKLKNNNEYLISCQIAKEKRRSNRRNRKCGRKSIKKRRKSF